MFDSQTTSHIPLGGKMSQSTQSPGIKRRKAYKGKGRANLVPYSTPINSLDLPIAMRMPQEILNNIFNNLVDHPVHFTRVAQVCKSWQLAADTHLYWRHLVKKLELPPPKPKAKKFKTFKRVVERDWGKFCSLCFQSHRNGHERLNLRAERIDLIRIAETYRDLDTRWFNIFKEDNVDFQASFDCEYGILKRLALREFEQSMNLNTKSTDENDLVVLDEDQFYQNVSSKNSGTPSTTATTTTTTTTTATPSLSSSSSFINSLPLPTPSANNLSSASFLSTSLNHDFSSTSPDNSFSSASSNHNLLSNDFFSSTSPNNDFSSASPNNSFLSTSSNDNFIPFPISQSTLSSNGNFLLTFPDAFPSTLTSFNFTLPFASSNPPTDSNFYPAVNPTDLFLDYSISDNDYLYNISDNTGITQASSSQDTTSSIASKSDCSPTTEQDSIFIRHHLCRACKVYIGQNGQNGQNRRSSVLRTLISDQKLPYTNFSRISRCTNYVNNGIGSPVAIIRYLIEKKWFSENTCYDELGGADDDRNEESIRSLALEMWVREGIEKGTITSFKDDPVEGRPPKSLWSLIDQTIERVLPLVAELHDLIEIIDDSDDNANPCSVILIED